MNDGGLVKKIEAERFAAVRYEALETWEKKIMKIDRKLRSTSSKL